MVDYLHSSKCRLYSSVYANDVASYNDDNNKEMGYLSRAKVRIFLSLPVAGEDCVVSRDCEDSYRSTQRTPESMHRDVLQSSRLSLGGN